MCKERNHRNANSVALNRGRKGRWFTARELPQEGRVVPWLPQLFPHSACPNGRGSALSPDLGVTEKF